MVFRYFAAARKTFSYPDISKIYMKEFVTTINSYLLVLDFFTVTKIRTLLTQSRKAYSGVIKSDISLTKTELV